MSQPMTTDFLVVGSGVAGLRAAIGASRYGPVLMLNKGTESSSQKAQGGIAAALNEEEAEIASHYQDTLDAGRGLCDPEAVRVLVEEGPERVQELIAWGATFDKIGDQFATALEGAHREPRILRAQGDATGNEIIKTLISKARSLPNLQLLRNHFAMDLIIDNGSCRGVWVLDEKQGAVYPILAQGVMLATGGAGQVFSRTTNPAVATGDGLAMALSAGAVMEDMEFVQFHPTALSLPTAPPFLLSEAMRGEGARLLNSTGKRFMASYHPDGELAPRDIVTHAIVNEMGPGGDRAVFLDITHLPSAVLQKRFPTIYAACQAWGLDLSKDRIPIAPAAHYVMGGIKTDRKGKTSIDRLWAAGEVAATGVHGANRLASNALLEGLVFGARVGEAAATINTGCEQMPIDPLPAASPEHPNEIDAAIQKKLKQMMWDNVGIIRSDVSLERATKTWRELRSALPPNALSRPALETRNLVMVAAAMIAAAKARKESIGAHFRQDAPERAGLGLPIHFAFQWETVLKAL